MIHLFCGATFAHACYELVEEQPEHEYLQDLLTDGLEVMVWDSHIPEDFVLWLKEEGNDYQDGYVFTWPEMLDKAPKVQTEWDAWKDANVVESSALPGGGQASVAPLIVVRARMVGFGAHRATQQQEVRGPGAG